MACSLQSFNGVGFHKNACARLIMTENQLDQRLMDYFDLKFITLKEELSEEAEISSNRLATQLKLDHVFKRKGCKLEFNFNKEVDVNLEGTAISIDKGEPGKAQILINEGRDLVIMRNKLVKVTDICEFRWNTVQQYVENDLADDSDNDRSLNKK